MPRAGRPKVPPHAKEFGQWVRRVREARGINQRELGRRGGVGAGQISRLELAGEGFLSIPLMEGIAKGLDLEFAYVMSKAGWGEPASRFSSFTSKEMGALMWAMTCGLSSKHDSPEVRRLVNKMADELVETLIDHLPAGEAEELLEEAVR